MHNTDEWERTKPRIRHPRYGPKLLSYLRIHCANEGSKTEGRLTEGKGIRIHANAGSLWENWRPGLQAGISPTPHLPLHPSLVILFLVFILVLILELLLRSFMVYLPHNKIYTHREPSTRRCTQWGCPLCLWSFAPDRAISTRSPASPTLDNTICSIMNLSRKCILPMPSEWQGLFGR